MSFLLAYDSVFMDNDGTNKFWCLKFGTSVLVAKALCGVEKCWCLQAVNVHLMKNDGLRWLLMVNVAVG